MQGNKLNQYVLAMLEEFELERSMKGNEFTYTFNPITLGDVEFTVDRQLGVLGWLSNEGVLRWTAKRIQVDPWDKELHDDPNIPDDQKYFYVSNTAVITIGPGFDKLLETTRAEVGSHSTHQQADVEVKLFKDGRVLKLVTPFEEHVIMKTRIDKNVDKLLNLLIHSYPGRRFTRKEFLENTDSATNDIASILRKAGLQPLVNVFASGTADAREITLHPSKVMSRSDYEALKQKLAEKRGKQRKSTT